MPRAARGLVEGCYYHVINRGNGRQRIFHKDGDFDALLSLIGEGSERYPVRLYAFCVMPNHFHLLVKPEEPEALSRWMQWLMTSHVRRYHQHYGTSGHLWQGRFKSFMIKDDDHLLTVARYIEANPVRDGIVQTAQEWRWSSHAARANGSCNGVRLEALPIDLPEPWTEYVDDPLTDGELEKLRYSVNRQAPYGDGEWQLKMCQDHGLESTMNSRGRPRKKGDCPL